MAAPFEIDEQDRAILLGLARATVEATARGRPLPALPQIDSYELQCGAGAFVTLHDSQGELRGCIGAMVAHAPLIETVREMAHAAASKDPRFAPVTPAELGGLRIEISVLGPMELIAPQDVVIGRHGLLIRSGTNSGVLLPQVAVEHGLGREEFLVALCRKAGLAADAWKRADVTLYAFEASVFGEQ